MQRRLNALTQHAKCPQKSHSIHMPLHDVTLSHSWNLKIIVFSLHREILHLICLSIVNRSMKLRAKFNMLFHHADFFLNVLLWSVFTVGSVCCTGRPARSEQGSSAYASLIEVILYWFLFPFPNSCLASGVQVPDQPVTQALKDQKLCITANDLANYMHDKHYLVIFHLVQT